MWHITQSLHRELEACSRLIHPHILPFIGTATFRLHTILLSPFMANGNLDTYLQMHEQADRAMLVRCQYFAFANSPR